MQFSVLTWNIHKGFTGGNRHFVLPRMRELIRSADVDLVFLQEVTGEHQVHAQRIDNWPQTPHFEFLADEVWPHYAYGKNAITDQRHHGNAILSKYPFRHWGNINVSLSRQASRSLLHGSLALPGTDKRLHVLCLHLGLFGLERRWQLRQLNRHLHAISARHDAVLIGGDFNDWNGRQVQKVLDPALELQEVFLASHQRYARTFPSRWPFLCMDRIYYRGLDLSEAHCLNDPQWRVLSDHVPLMARFTL